MTETPDSRCSRCHARLPAAARGARVRMGNTLCGQALWPCRRCGTLYRQAQVEEAALHLQEKTRVKWFLLSPGLLAALALPAFIPFLIVSAVAGAVNSPLASFYGLLGSAIFVGMVILLVSVCTFPWRLWRQKRVLQASRMRLLQDDEYLMELLPPVSGRQHSMELEIALHIAKARLKKCFDEDLLPDLDNL